MTRKVVVMLVGCLVLAGCGASEWQEKVRYKIAKVVDRPYPGNPKNANIRLELVGEVPDDVLEPVTLTPKIVSRGAIRGDFKVGDEVLCTAKQASIGYTRTRTIETDVSFCEKA